MSYPPPPGLNNSTNSRSTSNSPHPSLPARPPPASSKPFSGASNSNNASRGSNSGAFAPAFQAFAPRQVASRAPTHSSYQQPQPAPQPQPQQSQYSQQYYGGSDSTYGAAPVIHNPFPLPGTERSGYAAPDPEMEAQIAQWQSAYTSKDHNRGFATAATSANAAPIGGASGGAGSRADADHGAEKKQKTVVREGGGTTWTDSTLLEWDPSHFRLFVGNLAGEVTDESLLKAFSRWPSVQKARVIRDKRTSKSKGYGFVSFSNSDDFFQAGREMQGKYIGSHPVLIRRATTEVKAVTPRDNKHGKNKGKGGKGGGHGNGGGGGKHSSNAGIQKPGSKTKGGLKILG